MKRKKMGKNGRGMAAAFICAICLGVSGCTWEEDEIRVQLEHEEESNYVMVEVIRGDIVKKGNIQLQIREGQRSESAIYIGEKGMGTRYVNIGDTVKKGQLIGMLECNISDEEMKELEYRIARNTLLLGYTDTDENYALSERWWSYVYQSSGSESDWENLQSSIENINQTYRYRREDYQDAIYVDTKRLEAARQEREKNGIYAEIDGIYNGTYTIANTGYLHIQIIGETEENIFDCADLRYKDYFEGGEVVSILVTRGNTGLGMNAVPYDREHWEENGKMSFQILTADYQSNDYRKYLLPGATAIIYLTLDSREGVLCLSTAAVHRADGREYVYVLNDNGIREVRWVETGFRGDSKVEIISGLEEGENVVLK